MRINYGINRTTRKNGRKRVIHRCGVVYVRHDKHDEVMAAIRRVTPRGWSITGYCRP